MAGMVENPDGQTTELRRALGPWHLVGLGIGAVIGAGIFVITGHAAASYAGPAVVYSFAIAGVGCLFAALCYAEFASMIPVAGSAYTYAYATMGRFMAWFIGWDLMLEYLASGATVSVGWSGYFNDFMRYLGLPLPTSLTTAPLCAATEKICSTYHAGAGAVDVMSSIGLSGAYVNLPAMALVVIVSLVLVFGVNMTAKFNNAMVALKLVIVLMVIAVGLPHVLHANHTPFIPQNTGEWGHFGFSGVLRATGMIFFAFIGFDAVSVAAQEAKNPQRDVPIGILGSLVICTILYMLMSYVLTGIADYRTLNVAHPVALAVEEMPATRWMAPFVNVGAIVGLASVVLVLLLGQSRIFYAMARDGMLPPMFKAIHPKFQTPWRGSLVTMVFCALLAGLCPIDILGELVSIGTLLAFVIVCAGVMIMRIARPELPRPFRTPFLFVIAPLGIITCGAMMYWLPIDTWIRLIAWTLIGLVIFFAYSRHHAKAPRFSVREDAE